MNKILFGLFLCVSMSTAFARADVSLRNGNFFVTLRDLSYPGGIEPKIERVYNSKSDFQGMFGYSYGSEYETHLSVDPDGSLIVTEFGGGANIRFIPKAYQAKDLDTSVSQLVEAAKKAGLISNAKSLSEYQQKLKDNYEYRAKQYAAFVTKGLLQKRIVKEGTQYSSTQYQYQYMTRVKGGYTRVMEGGAIQKFNDSGKLVQLMDRNKNFMNFTYDSNQRLVSLIDNQNRKMTFTYNQFGLVDRISGESGKYAAYRYSKEGFLVWSRDDAGVENSFAYTNDQFRNLTEIGYPNQKDSRGKQKKMVIQYYGPEKNSSVKAVFNPDGTSNEYEYLSDLKNPTYYAVRVVLKDSDGAKLSDSKYEYYYKIRAGGEEFTSKMISTLDGVVTETLYDEKLGFPIQVTSNGKKTTMQYDSKGHMLKKVTPLETIEMSYDPKIGKMTKVVRKVKSGSVTWSEFKYDQVTGNPIFARNNENKSVKLIYDNAGRVRVMIDQTGRQLSFKYNELSKPIEIKDAKMGSVKFTYKNSGEVDKVQANGGANTTAEVLRFLQTLTEITAQAGVTMSI